MPKLKGVPTLLADIYIAEDGTYHMKAWCPYCEKFHSHGEVDTSWRAAHCFKGPLKSKGYYLKLNPDNPTNVELQNVYKKMKRLER
ncbi:hypothetical protein H9650_14210 [Psychrobacillus sp. Sa2BUA9]|uniref:Uncharacterized protein n=1 Tax=Psychrobacillus faecigallinarum TaxID=2762235 RepID=A0ABR8RBZ2_9BACI|nr:hypothetical protein [Psychrobacillus faecigallinarum]MBD7945276.1 hypothetical protein [Psychrobacillus faecigallinarum]